MATAATERRRKVEQIEFVTTPPGDLERKFDRLVSMFYANLIAQFCLIGLLAIWLVCALIGAIGR